jgi:hypothetical protein
MMPARSVSQTVNAPVMVPALLAVMAAISKQGFPIMSAFICFFAFPSSLD